MIPVQLPSIPDVSALQTLGDKAEVLALAYDAARQAALDAWNALQDANKELADARQSFAFTLPSVVTRDPPWQM